jgi:parallel beta-helix repeat protein
MKRTALGLTLILALLAVVVADRALANPHLFLYPDLPHVYIRSDGSVEPSSAPIERTAGTYALTFSIVGFTLEVQRDHVVVDGAGFSIRSNASGQLPLAGVIISDRNSVTVKNLVVEGFHEGVRIYNSSNSIIVHNTIVSNEIGIGISWSKDTFLGKNNITSNAEDGIFVDSSDRTKIAGNNVTRNGSGIGHDTLIPSIFTNVIILGNNISENTGTGISIGFRSQIDLIVGNNISLNGIGVSIWETVCTLYRNNFIGNTLHCDFPTGFWSYEELGGQPVPGKLIVWDNGKEGNYWSNYTGSDANGDGIGDTPHVIQVPCVWWVDPATNTSNLRGIDAKDNFPLMAPFDISTIPIEPPSYLDFSLPDLPPTPTPTSIPTQSPSPFSSPQETEPEPFLTTLVIVSVSVVAIIAIGLFVYFKKFHRNKSL